MGTLPGRLSRIGWRRVVLSTAMAVGGVLVAGSLAWACTALVHSVTFKIAPPSSTCQAMQDINGDGGTDWNEHTPSYDCTEVEVSITGHASEDCSPEPGCEVQQEVHQRMLAHKRSDLPGLAGCASHYQHTKKIGEIPLTHAQDVSVSGDPQGVNGDWFTGAGLVEPNVNPDSDPQDRGRKHEHPPDSVRYYQMCTGPNWAEEMIGIAKIGQKP